MFLKHITAVLFLLTSPLSNIQKPAAIHIIKAAQTIRINVFMTYEVSGDTEAKLGKQRKKLNKKLKERPKKKSKLLFIKN